MYYVYLIKSKKYPDKIYVGYTLDLKSRIKKHNEGGSIYTAKYKPWELILFLGFKEKEKALSFEKYLKLHSGRSFLQKRFL